MSKKQEDNVQISLSEGSDLMGAMMGMLGQTVPEITSPQTEDVSIVQKNDKDILDRLMGKEPEEGETPKPEQPKDEQEKPDVEKTDGNDPKNDDESEDIIEEQQGQETPEKTPSGRLNVKDAVNILIQSGTWEDVAIKYDDKEYESIQDLLSKEKVTSELLESLAEAQKQNRESQFQENYIKLDDPKSPSANLARAIATGGDYKEFLEYKEQVLDPVVSIDFYNTKDGDIQAEQFVRHCLQQIDNLPANYVDGIINQLKTDFSLLDKAREYQTRIIDNYNTELQNKMAQEQEKRVQQEREYQEFKTKALEELVNEHQFNKEYAGKLVDSIYLIDPKTGKYHYEMKLQERLEKDPKFYIELAHFAEDPEDYINKKKAGVKKEDLRRIMTIAGTTPKKGGGDKTRYTPATPQERDDAFLSYLKENSVNQSSVF